MARFVIEFFFIIHMPNITISIVTLAFYSRERLAALPYGATALVIGVISLGFDNHRSRRSFFY
jgi:hypothetical protein